MDADQILHLLRERMIAFAASRLGRDLAEDLAQEVLMLLHEKYPAVVSIEELVPLSLQIMRFKLFAARRKSTRRGEFTQVSVDDIQLPDERLDPESLASRREMLERLAEAMSHLGERCKELFRLKLEGKTYAEIQGILGASSVNTVYTWDFRCRKDLLERMGGSWEGKP